MHRRAPELTVPSTRCDGVHHQLEGRIEELLRGGAFRIETANQASVQILQIGNST